MTKVSMTRRGVMHGIAVAATIPFACGKAIGAATAAIDGRMASTAALLRVAFPHPRLTPDFYRGVAETMERKLGLDEGTLLEKPWKELTKKQRDI